MNLMTLKTLSIILITLNSAISHSSVFSPRLNLSPIQATLVTEALEDIQGRLPPSLIQSLPSFEISSFNETSTSSISAACLPDGSVHYGDSKTVFGMTRVRSNKIELFINKEILDTEDISNCSHGQKKNILIRTLIHEISHIYDFDGRREQKSSNCTLDSIVLSYDCLRKNKVSDDLQFSLLAGFRPIYKEQEQDLPESHDELYYSRLNIFTDRSPRSYEDKNLQEYFAVNMEYYILDPEYKCRRPALFKYLNSHFNFDPNHSMVCASGFSVIGSNQKILTLDPNRIYAIHYLKTTPGENLESRWGHALIRLIVCAPERFTVTENCLKDTRYHVIIDFAAQLLDENISLMKGLLGYYSNAPNFQLLNDLRSETLLASGRNLESYPLELNRDEIDNFVRSISQLYWTQESRYLFFQNNCATQVMNSIFSSIQRPEIRNSITLLEMYSPGTVITPSNLTNYFAKLGLINLKGYAKIPEYTFFRSTIGTIEINLREFFQNKYALEKHFSLTSQQRNSFYQVALSNTSLTQSKKQQLVEGFINIEQIIASKIYQSSTDLIGQVRAELFEQKKLKKQDLRQLPTAKNPEWDGYGIPQNIQNQLKLILDKVNEDTSSYIKIIVAELSGEQKYKLNLNNKENKLILENIDALLRIYNKNVKAGVN